MERFEFSMLRPQGVPDSIVQCEIKAKKGSATSAFVLFLRLAIELNDPKWKAYCWYWMGQLVAPNMDLNPLDMDDGGIFYYRQALIHDPECAHAWASIIIEYTTEPWGHNDRELAERAAYFFLQSQDKRPSPLVALVKQRVDLYGLKPHK